MKKASVQLLLSILLFAGIWFLLSRIDFVGDTTTETIGRETEERLGKLLIRQLELNYSKTRNDSLVSVVNSIHQKISDANDIDPESMTIHIFNSSTINAAVLPGRNIIVFTGLLEFTENAEEFAGVLAHEMGHITENHVMDRMMAEFGTTLLLMLSGMDAGSEIVANILRILVSSAFSREQEREADLKAVEFLAAAHIDPLHLGNFMLRISTKETSGPVPEWISTHPDSRRRATMLFEKSDETEIEQKPLYNGDWQELTSSMRGR